MPRQEKADGLIFPTQAFGRKPGLHLRQHDLLARCASTEQFALTNRGRFMSALRASENDVNDRKNPRPVFLERIECPGGGETFQRSEERRVGKEWNSRRWRDHDNE